MNDGAGLSDATSPNGLDSNPIFEVSENKVEGEVAAYELVNQVGQTSSHQDVPDYMQCAHLRLAKPTCGLRSLQVTYDIRGCYDAVSPLMTVMIEPVLWS